MPPCVQAEDASSFEIKSSAAALDRCINGKILKQQRMEEVVLVRAATEAVKSSYLNPLASQVRYLSLGFGNPSAGR
jgi:hypothetical protein